MATTKGRSAHLSKFSTLLLAPVIGTQATKGNKKTEAVATQRPTQTEASTNETWRIGSLSHRNRANSDHITSQASITEDEIQDREPFVAGPRLLNLVQLCRNHGARKTIYEMFRYGQQR